MSQSHVEATYKTLPLSDIIDTSNISAKIPSPDEIRKQNLKETWQEVINGIKGWRFWWALTLSETKRRYTRTTLGPFWTSLNLGIFIAFIGTVFAVLWKTNIKTFLPYFTAGYISWVFISAIITESCNTFISSELFLKNLPLNYTYFSWDLIARNVLVLLHHFCIYLLVALIFLVPIQFNILLILPAIFLICLTGFGVSIILGILCARYRDIKQFVNSILQISLFCTPILWSADQFKGTTIGILLNLNPFLHYIKILRDPLIGQTPEMISWIAATMMTIFILWFAINMLSRHYKKLIYWL
jgi:lipopolysaccharide transport system permease protein